MVDPERIQQVHERMGGNPASYDESTTSTTDSDGGGGQTTTKYAFTERVAGQLPTSFLNSGRVGNRFLSDIFQEEKKTPHNEMEATRDMRMRNAFVETAVNTVRDLIMGKFQRVTAEDEQTAEWFNNEWRGFEPALQAQRNSIDDFIGMGNGYTEIIRDGYPVDFRAFSHPERMWIKKEGSDVTDYILEIPQRFVEQADRRFKRFEVGYGSVHHLKTVVGQQFDPEKIIHTKMGQGDVDEYGRSPLASAESDHKILKEIERSMAIFARFKSVPKKAVSVTDSTGQPLNSPDFDELVRDWNQTGDFENFLTNGRKLDINDLDYSDAQARFEPMLNYLKRKITSVLGPEFYFHGETTTHAVSSSQLTTFFLQIQGWRGEIKDPWNTVLEEVVEHPDTPSFLSTEGLEWEYGPFDFETDQEKQEKALKAWTQGMVTNDEARSMAGFEEADDEEIGRAYKWEVDQGGGGPFDQLMNKLNELEDQQDVEDG